MAKYVDAAVLDGALGIVAGATRLLALNGQPASLAAAIAGRLAEAALTGASFGLGAGDVSGRKLTVAAQIGLSVIAAGTADHVALIDGTRLLYVTTCPAQLLPAGGTVGIGAWAIEIENPA